MAYDKRMNITRKMAKSSFYYAHCTMYDGSERNVIIEIVNGTKIMALNAFKMYLRMCTEKSLNIYTEHIQREEAAMFIKNKVPVINGWLYYSPIHDFG